MSSPEQEGREGTNSPKTLSPKPFPSYNPAEFRLYVQSLLRKPESKRPKAVKPEVTWKLGKRGGALVQVKRNPKRITQAEFLRISDELKVPINLLFIQLKKKGIGVDP